MFYWRKHHNILWQCCSFAQLHLKQNPINFIQVNVTLTSCGQTLFVRKTLRVLNSIPNCHTQLTVLSFGLHTTQSMNTRRNGLWLCMEKASLNALKCQCLTTSWNFLNQLKCPNNMRPWLARMEYKFEMVSLWELHWV